MAGKAVRENGKIGIACIEYELGELRSIAELFPEGSPDGDSLAALGLECYARSEASPADLAIAACRRTLDGIRGLGIPIDAVVFASSSFQRSKYYLEDTGRLLAELGLPDAYPFGLHASYCNNLVSAMAVARGLVAAGEARNVLLALADRADTPEFRIMEGSISILSDGAASCLVGLDIPAEFRLRSLALRNRGALVGRSMAKHFSLVLKEFAAGIKEVSATALAGAGIEPLRCGRLFANNYNLSVQRILLSQAGFTQDQAYLDNLPRFAHAYAGDALINLKDHVRRGGALPGDTCMLLGTGTFNFGAAILEKA